ARAGSYPASGRGASIGRDPAPAHAQASGLLARNAGSGGGAMDALSDVLRIVRLTGAVFMDAEFTDPWCIGEPSGVEVCIEHMPGAQHVVIYHLVTEGRCDVAVPRRASPKIRKAPRLTPVTAQT